MLGKPSSTKPVERKFSAGPCVLRLAGQRVDEGDVVGQLRQMRDQIGDHLAGLAARAELVLRPGQIAGRPWNVTAVRRAAACRLA